MLGQPRRRDQALHLPHTSRARSIARRHRRPRSSTLPTASTRGLVRRLTSRYAATRRGRYDSGVQRRRTVAFALCAGVLASGVAWAAPAQADATDDAFLSALTNAGVGTASTPRMPPRWGSRCARCWSQPGQNAADVAAKVADAGRHVAWPGHDVHRHRDLSVLPGSHVVDRQWGVADPPGIPRLLGRQPVQSWPSRCPARRPPNGLARAATPMASACSASRAPVSTPET